MTALLAESFRAHRSTIIITVVVHPRHGDQVQLAAVHALVLRFGCGGDNKSERSHLLLEISLLLTNDDNYGAFVDFIDIDYYDQTSNVERVVYLHASSGAPSDYRPARTSCGIIHRNAVCHLREGERRF